MTLLFIKKKRTSEHVNSESANERRRYCDFSPPASPLAPDVVSANQGKGEVKSMQSSERVSALKCRWVKKKTLFFRTV